VKEFSKSVAADEVITKTSNPRFLKHGVQWQSGGGDGVVRLTRNQFPRL